ncbi:MAG: hypothetical protein OXI26_00020 [bacterium]|nr:hypothetical protein [bacterium]
MAGLGAIGILAAACGSGEDGSPGAQQAGVTVTVPEQIAEDNAAALASRPGEGISAAGGTLQAGEPCPAPGTPGAPETHKIAVVTPDVNRLGEIGLGALVFDSFDRTFDAYINQVNSFGGINGNCFEFAFYEYGFTNPAEEIGAICAELPQQEPLVLFGFGLSQDIAGCLTLAGQIPTVGLYAQFPEAFFAQTAGLLVVDHGSEEFLLDNGLRTAVNAGVLGSDDGIGLLYAEDATAASMQATFEHVSGDLGLNVVTSAGVPAALYGTAVVVIEEQFRAAGGRLFHPDDSVFAGAVGAMPPELGELLAAVRQQFISTATAMRDAGVNTVVATASWDSVRSLMRAAETIGWHPRWITNDSQFSLIVLTDAPEAQGQNLVQISSRRAADDPIDGLDRGCLSLRNTGTAAEPFSHRYHTDAWSLLTATCDYLDVVFSAASRVSGPLTREAFLAELQETKYVTAHGQHLHFTDGDPYGSDSFRVLSADPTCVLNDWGCMRPLTDWFVDAEALEAHATHETEPE